MNFNHVCLIVSDTEKSIKLFRDVLGFTVKVDKIIPDGIGPDKYFGQQTLDDIFHSKDSKSRMVILVSDEGAMIELEEPLVPKVKKVPREYLEYGYVGISEVAFNVTNIDEWLEKIKAAGYETQTNYVWEIMGGAAKSFLFYDDDGHMIQLFENIVR